VTNFPKIYVAGHRDMVGWAIVRQLLAQGQPAERIVSQTHAELDLCNQAAVNVFF
jgi:GDP-L-fucose synthase